MRNNIVDSIKNFWDYGVKPVLETIVSKKEKEFREITGPFISKNRINMRKLYTYNSGYYTTATIDTSNGTVTVSQKYRKAGWVNIINGYVDVVTGETYDFLCNGFVLGSAIDLVFRKNASSGTILFDSDNLLEIPKNRDFGDAYYPE